MLNAINRLCIALYCNVKSFVEEEKGAVDLVTIVVLIAVAIVLAIAFKDRVAKLLKGIFDNMDTSGAHTSVDMGQG